METINQYHKMEEEKYDDWQSYYTPDLEAKVYEFLKNDFERFGYKRLKF